MHSTAFSTRLVIAAAVALTAACGGDSTEPGGVNDPQRAAARFDSMYVSLNARGTRPDYFWRRAEDMHFFEIPAAFGTVPVTIQVIHGGAVESWKGYEVQYDSVRDDGYVDSTYWVAAYKGTDLDEFFIAYYDYTYGHLVSVLYGADTSETSTTSGDFFSLNMGAPGSCIVPHAASDSLVSNIAGTPCVRASFGTRLLVQFPPGTDGLDTTSISIQNVTIPGVLLTRGDTSIHPTGRRTR
jgi:hypothetical protein